MNMYRYFLLFYINEIVNEKGFAAFNSRALKEHKLFQYLKYTYIFMPRDPLTESEAYPFLLTTTAQNQARVKGKIFTRESQRCLLDRNEQRLMGRKMKSFTQKYTAEFNILLGSKHSISEVASEVQVTTVGSVYLMQKTRILFVFLMPSVQLLSKGLPLFFS